MSLHIQQNLYNASHFGELFVMGQVEACHPLVTATVIAGDVLGQVVLPQLEHIIALSVLLFFYTF